VDQPLIVLAQGNFVLLGGIVDIAHWTLYILVAAVALGLVIFVHELGHFAVAKMCGVKCEKFFLGFDIAGKKFWSRQWGETEYGIGVLPLGGYVKMLGQDDNPTRAEEERERSKLKAPDGGTAPADGAANAVPPEHPSSGDLPHEPTADDREVFDPRSYMAKSVPQRMAIISAGVIMNLIFAVIFATIAYRCGVSYTPCVIGEPIPGDPAWTQGIRPGDRIVQFNHDKPSEHLRFFEDLMLQVMFTGPGEELHLVIDRPADGPHAGSGKTIDVTVEPTDAHKAESGGKSLIGVLAAESNQLGIVKDSATKPPAAPESPAAKADPPLEGGDRIVAGVVDGVDHQLQNGVQIEALLAQHPDHSIQFTVLRGADDDPAAEPKKLDITVAPAPLHDLGLVMQMGPIAAVQKGSPADAAHFRPGDRIKSIDGRPVDDPMLLPDEMGKLAGKPITVEVRRNGDDGHESIVALTVTPRLPMTFNRLPMPGSYGCDALGIAYPVLNTVGSVRPGVSGGAKEIQTGDKLVSAEFVPTEEQKKRLEEDGIRFSGKPLTFDDDHLRWPELQTVVQWTPAEVPIKLTFQRGDKEISATLKPIEVAGRFYPGRGFLLDGLSEIRKADSWSEATELGLRETKESVMQIVTTVRKIASGGVSPTGLGGPGTIAVVAAASASQGIPKLLIFLTLLSANLAVINFLPIPILDGGHIMFLLYEGIRGKPASERVQMYLTYLGLVFILTLMIFVIGLDISRGIKWIISLFS
jgi:regulator of sigma E protease